MCWVAADRGAKLAQLRGDQGLAANWRRASVLLIPLVGFLPPGDERVRATVLAIADELTEDELVLRYRVEETDDGFEGEEGTFTICSFWLVSALTEIGEVARARALCEKLLSLASPLLLYAEEIDPHTGRHLGNFPQAFSHLALINAVMHLINEDRHIAASSILTCGLDPGGPGRGPEHGGTSPAV
jgi:alpha,alpha-trehalase